MNKIWWLWLPLVVIAVQLVLEFSFSADARAVMLSEDGPHEMLQFLVILGAFFIAAVTLCRMDRKSNPWLTGWVGLACLCSLYVAGEEISWGQHILEWSTPEYWTHLNDQQETNLHNTSSWLDQKPRLLLEIGVVTGGLLIPLFQKIKPALVPARFNVIYPPPRLAVVAALAIGVKITEKITEALGVPLFERASEIEELYLFYFVFLYLAALYGRIIRR